VRIDQLDNPSIPKAGYFANVNFRAEREGLGSELDYEKLDFTTTAALTFGRLTTIVRGKWGDPLGSQVPFYDSFTLGGLFNLSGYSRNQLLGRSAGLAEAIFYYQLSKGGAIIQSTYLGASAEAGNVWNAGDARTVSSLHGAGSVFIAADTILGPFYLAYGYSGSKHTSFYVLLARYF
jgi:NTE family protein